jgi:hypothetical protein
MKLRNPLISEGMVVLFTHPRVKRSYLLYVLLLFFVLLASWPGRSITEYLAENLRPMTFGFVSVALFLCMAFFSLRYSTTRIAGERFHSTSDWLEYSPVNRIGIVYGKTAFAVFHTFFLLLLAAPFIVISGAATGVPPALQLTALAIIFCAALTYRIIGVFFSLFLDERPILYSLTAGFCAMFLGLLTLFIHREMNPFYALFAVFGEELVPFAAEAEPLPLAAVAAEAVRIHLIISAAFAAASAVLIYLLPGRQPSPFISSLKRSISRYGRDEGGRKV